MLLQVQIAKQHEQLVEQQRVLNALQSASSLNASQQVNNWGLRFMGGWQPLGPSIGGWQPLGSSIASTYVHQHRQCKMSQL